MGNKLTDSTKIYEGEIFTMSLTKRSTKPKDCSEHINMRYDNCKDAINDKGYSTSSFFHTHENFKKTDSFFLTYGFSTRPYTIYIAV